MVSPEKKFKISAADPKDADDFLKIYTPYITSTAITFELEIPSADEFAERMRRTLTKYPYLKAESAGSAAGYAYASAFKDRKAYDYSAEVSIYISADLHLQGLGTLLYEKLFAILKAQGITNVYACIAKSPRIDDRYLTNASEIFHSKLGFKTCGHFSSCGFKFGSWYDMIWMEKQINERPLCPKPFIPYPKLDPALPCLNFDKQQL